ncbi:D123-domain-containing protein [Dothidotthia symphoricarpi CBS 119687]|uniref:D123-domain-containing protein n=1 Tax=Dothidotthia symphoricarpi CBS 119687 TaxID=1392245 RepID=A0A6A6AD96_9PLEO|nr:D123-domain-containing protein [Dothidotthia symphoricarpi CBS 119687]KAF2128847.1 D123-domain-containing protein [Dothidotthia symphoricarpi CBS 119687]
MSSGEATSEVPAPAFADGALKELPFPPVTKNHILNCSYHSWHPKYRAATPKARLVSLPPAFLDYLRSDGIILPPEETDNATWSDNDSGIFSGADNNEDEDEETLDPSANWRETHEAIERTIEELGGKVAPKLNWSAPKDATWIAATNSMECQTPNDIYLLLKSSDFITHDIAHAFDDTVDQFTTPDPEIPYHLVLRKWITLNPSVEFRCFVRNRQLIALCQRDLNHFDFLFNMQDKLRRTIQDFFDLRLRDTFPDPNFAFDVYVPPPHDKVWLVDVNPWAMRTDPLLFSWMELLTMEVPDTVEPKDETAETTIRLRLARPGETDDQTNDSDEDTSDEDETDDEDVEEVWQPEFRLIRSDDPEAYGFTTPQYSAHKLPKDVVDASSGGEGNLREFAMQWQEAQKLAEQQRQEDSEDD